jgi:glycosyltransferase involved in cell wall biosynthesis
VLYVADSTLLGVPLPPVKRLRYRLKPFKWIDDEMAELYDACVAVSADTQAWFQSRSKPWLWLPSGIDPERVRRGVPGPSQGPLVFGYFGHAGEHTGVPQLLRVFVARLHNAELRVCCFGRARAELVEAYRGHPRVSFHGPFDPEGCVEFGTGCDVLVNPRPVFPGNQNNFPSKVFEYALSGRPVLSSQISGVDRVLGPDAFYFDNHDFHRSLTLSFDCLAATDRAELQQRGLAIQQHMGRDFSWQAQGQRLTSFLGRML